MAENSGSAGGCFKKGCLGCGVAILLLISIPLMLSLVAVISAPEPEPVSSTSRQELPPLPGPGPEPLREAAEGATAIRQPATGSAELGSLLSEAEPVAVVLELAGGRFEIEPGKPGEPIGVDADYDRSRYEFEESYDEATRTYRLRLEPRFSLRSFIHIGGSDSEARLTLTLPRGYPLTVASSIRMGQSFVDLGGLWVSEADLDFGAGDHRLTFSEPLARPAERLDVEGSFGELEVEQIGNASPRTVSIGHSAGSFQVDLAGDWRQDSDVTIRGGFGECRIDLPDNARVEIERARVTFGERRMPRIVTDLPEDAPTIRLSASATAGDFRIR